MMRVAIIHDWLLGMRGGEHCLSAICSQYPQADLYTLFYRAPAIASEINRHHVRASHFNALPVVERYYRHLLPFYPLAIKSLETQLWREHQRAPYDLVISISHCAAKNILLPREVLHLCYCLTPVRYFWDQYDRYFQNKFYEPLVRALRAPFCRWDIRGAQGVTQFVAISEFVQKRIESYYGRNSLLLYPPVSTDWLVGEEQARGEEFLAVNALVPYKNTHLLIQAFNELGLPLTIVGQGPEEGRLRRQAKTNIKFLGFVERAQLAALYRGAKALVFAAEEDFGIAPVEMQATGGPVIAYGAGGVLETVSVNREKPTGLLFNELSVPAIKEAVMEFLNRQEQFQAANCREQAAQFSVSQFLLGFNAAVDGLSSQPLDKRAKHA